jgi:hypothetical protein
MIRPDQTLIRNCRFAFRCHQQWRSLEQTGDPRVRYCHECSRPVVLCQRDEELRTALEADECIALPVPELSDSPHYVGLVAITPYNSEE